MSLVEAVVLHENYSGVVVTTNTFLLPLVSCNEKTCTGFHILVHEIKVVAQLEVHIRHFQRVRAIKLLAVP